MECYDVDAGRGVEYFLNGVDATTRRGRLYGRCIVMMMY